MQTVDDATHWERTGDGTFEGQIGESWGNGPAAFGGIVAAAFLRQFQRRLDFADHPIRTLEMHLCAPVFFDETTVVDVTLDRKGQSVSHLSAKMSQSGNTCATANATFAADNSDKPTFDRLAAPDIPAPGDVEPMPETPLTPNFAKHHFEHRFAIGDMPMSGSETPLTGGWLRPSHPMPADNRLVCNLMDAWLPSMFVTYEDFRRTVTADIRYQFIEPPPAPGEAHEDEESPFYLFRAEVQSAFDGYATEDAELWTEDGTLLARVQQMYVILD